MLVAPGVLAMAKLEAEQEVVKAGLKALDWEGLLRMGAAMMMVLAETCRAQESEA